MAWDDIPDWSEEVANSILTSVYNKDPFTYSHCCRVGAMSRHLAQAMGLNEFEQAVLEYSGLFHDVGKVAIPDSVLLKPGKLTGAEIEIMKSHPEKSAEIVQPLTHSPFFRFMIPGIRYHHERIDGGGYPFNMSGERIPLPARIICVVDTYDAMIHARPYRKPIAEEKVLKELKEFSGHQFDANLVNVFLEALPYWKKKSKTEMERELVIVPQLLKKAA